MFGSLGLVDDLRHIYSNTLGKFKGLSTSTILLFQVVFAISVALILFFKVGLNNIYIPVFGNIILGWWYIPLAVFAIVAFTNAYNISDGLDGLSTGLLTICLFAFLALVNSVFDQNLAVFVGLWIGALIAYLYFNVFPARIYLGDAGAFSFGATLAVVGLLTGKILALAVIGGIYVIIILSSLVQILSKKILKRKIMPVSPLHMYFKYIGWEEPKIVMRFWLAGSMFAIFGLWLALLSK
jgi:phospho-N-acetylmuramoyl-pentapeptide-transferase